MYCYGIPYLQFQYLYLFLTVERPYIHRGHIRTHSNASSISHGSHWNSPCIIGSSDKEKVMSSCSTWMNSLLYHQLTAYMMNKLTFCILSFLLFIIQSLRQYLNIHSSTIGGSNHSLFKQSSSPVKEMKVCACMYVDVHI